MKFKHKIDLLVNKSKSELLAAKWQAEMQLYADVSRLCDSRFISLENMDFGNVMGEEYCVFHTRFIDGVDENMRIEFENKTFEIKRIINKNFSNKILSIIALEI